MIGDYQPGSLLDAFVARGIAFRRSVSDPSEISICCPFCVERRFRLGINIVHDVAHCFNCEWKSRKATEALSEALDLGVLTRAQEEIEAEKEVEVEKPSLPEDFVLLSDLQNDTFFKRARRYLSDRRVESWQIEEKKIGISMTGKYAYRVIFPIYYGERLQGIVGRDFTGQAERKYLNSAGEKALYNLPVKRKDHVVLCEGIFDCLALERAVLGGNYDVVALLGRTLSQKQEQKLKSYENVVLCPDGDTAGVDGFMKIGKYLSLNHRISVLIPSGEGKDAGDLQPDGLKRLWQSRTQLSDAVELQLRVKVGLHG